MELVCTGEHLLSLESQYDESEQMLQTITTALMLVALHRAPLLTLKVSGKSTKELQRLCTQKMGKAGKSGLSRLPEEGKREYGKRKGRGK